MVFRVARHTNKLELIVRFYCDILNFEILGSFENHDEYDGVFIGRKELNWHLEFTKSTVKAQHQFDADDILVFYPKTSNDYNKILENIMQNNIEIKKSKKTLIGIKTEL